MKQRTCQNCDHWFQYHQYGDNGDIDFVLVGSCRRYAPKPMAHLNTGDEASRLCPVVSWAETTSDEWCGDWKEAADHG